MNSKRYLVFNDQYPHGSIQSAEYVRTYPDFTTYVELESDNEATQWAIALRDMQPIFKMEDIQSNKPLN